MNHPTHYKILFAGPVGAGKTSAIAAVSDTGVAQTEAPASDEVALRKENTTVAMDYGSVAVDPQLTIRLVGTPGQVRFSFMWEILAEGAIGVMVLIDNARPDPIADLHTYLDAFRALIEHHGGAAVIAITRTDLGGGPRRADYVRALSRRGLRLPVLEVDARSREDIKNALLILTAMLDPSSRRSH